MRFLALLLIALCAPWAAAAQATPPARQPAPIPQDDWAKLQRYQRDNAALPAAKAPRIVFMGDSITAHWVQMDGKFFTPDRIGRGISGQTTSQMLLRFRQDVIDLHPAVVHIMAGTNDIAGNTGPITEAQIEANIQSMVELAQAHGIRIILASIPPADLFPWRSGVAPAEEIARINGWLKAYAAKTGSVYADYWSALKGDGLAMREALSSDHVHPTEAGYAVMDPIAVAAIRQALARLAPRRSRR